MQAATWLKYETTCDTRTSILPYYIESENRYSISPLVKREARYHKYAKCSHSHSYYTHLIKLPTTNTVV